MVCGCYRYVLIASQPRNTSPTTAIIFNSTRVTPFCLSQAWIRPQAVAGVVAVSGARRRSLFVVCCFGGVQAFLGDRRGASRRAVCVYVRVYVCECVCVWMCMCNEHGSVLSAYVYVCVSPVHGSSTPLILAVFCCSDGRGSLAVAGLSHTTRQFKKRHPTKIQ